MPPGGGAITAGVGVQRFINEIRQCGAHHWRVLSSRLNQSIQIGSVVGLAG
jgi:hypothetical protein